MMSRFQFISLLFICYFACYCSGNQSVPYDDAIIVTENTSETNSENFNTSGANNENFSSNAESLEDLTITGLNILFIGNSLTYTNDLPGLVKTRAKQKGITIGTKMIALPNYAILDHWSDGEVQKEINSKKYQFVIIQQGPSSQPFGRQVLIEYGQKYSALCEVNNAKLAYFMVWPSLANYETFDGVILNHKEAALINKAILCPVGEVWKTHFDNTNNFDYYGPDGFHPSFKGSQVAASVIVATLFP